MSAQTRNFFRLETLTPLLVLGILLLYSYAHFFVRRYIGFRLDSSTGEVFQVYSPQAGDPPLLPGDRIIEVNGIPWEVYNPYDDKILFEDVRAGEVLDFLIQRDERMLTVHWRILPPATAEIINRIIDSWWLAYPFWLAGTAALLLVRPRDNRRLLMAAFLFLNSIWLSAGMASANNIWKASSVFHIAIWLNMPVALHLHWLIPQPLGKTPILIKALYPISIIFALLEWLHFFPKNTYIIGGLFSVGVGISLLVAHAIKFPRQRREVFLLLFIILISIAPVVILSLTNLIGQYTWLDNHILVFIIGLPAAYFIAIYRRQFGELELRVNRVISIYAYVTLFTIAFLSLTGWLASFLSAPERNTILGFTTISAIVSSASALVLFPIFHRFIERRVIGISISTPQLLSTYSERITTSLELEALLSLLRKEILPSLLIRQAVLLRIDPQDTIKMYPLLGVNGNMLPTRKSIQALQNTSGKYISPTDNNDLGTTLQWIRLVLPLKIDDKLIGFMLLGRRDPDDFYPQAEVEVLQAIANQTAIALTNIDQAQRFQALYQSNIDRHEKERQKIALELHDDVLNQLTAMMMNPDDQFTPEHLRATYQELTYRIRNMIRELRPAMQTMVYASPSKNCLMKYANKLRMAW